MCNLPPGSGVKNSRESLGMIYMKKILCIIAALAMVCSLSAGAESTVLELDELLFADAKQALTLFEAGDYETAASLLEFADAVELEKFITGNYTTFGTEPVQTEVSVAWWTGSAWLIAVPLHEPAAPEVETLVLLTSNIDCSAFCGYTYALWGDIETALTECDYVIWNEEYTEDESMVIYMDD